MQRHRRLRLADEDKAHGVYRSGADRHLQRASKHRHSGHCVHFPQENARVNRSQLIAEVRKVVIERAVIDDDSVRARLKVGRTDFGSARVEFDWLRQSWEDAVQ